MYNIHQLQKTYPPNKDVLHQLNLQIGKGEFIAIIGASGSGKSTFLRCISLKERWSNGYFTYQNKSYYRIYPWDYWKLARDFVLLEDTPYFNTNKSALKHVLQGRIHQKSIIHKITATTSRNNHILGMDYLEHVGLLDKGHIKISELSGGEKQRVAIARALIQGAQFLFADEPTTGLDLKSVEFILDDMRKLALQNDKTIVCVLNKLELVAKYATRIIGLVDGKIQLDIAARSLTLAEKNTIFGSYL